jgi:hypothetical protein
MRANQLQPARCALFGYTPTEITLDGQPVRRTLLAPELQSGVGIEAYDAGAAILAGFFKAELQQFLTDDLDPLGRDIIELCMTDATVEDYEALTPMFL